MNPSEEILKARGIAKKTGCRLVFEIDQSNHPIIENFAQGKFADAKAGVCAMMTAHWIKYGKSEASPGLAFEAFKQTVDGNMKTIIIDQTVYMHERDARKKLFEKYTTLRNEYKKTNNGSLLAPDPSANEQVKQKWKDGCFLKKVVDKAQKAERRRGGGGNPGNKICRAAELRDVKDNIVITLKKGGEGFFRVEYDGGELGHVIGIHYTSSNCLLMDANSGLWECSSPVALEALFKAITDTFYHDFSTCDVVSYGSAQLKETGFYECL
jgi:hypothetical protein